MLTYPGHAREGYPQPEYGHDSYGTHQHYDQPPQSHYGAPPPGPPGSNLPPGWIQQWDPNSQRYYYVEQATGRTEWEPPYNPSYGPPPGGHSAYGGHDSYGQSRDAYGGHDSYGAHGGYGGYDSHGYSEHHKEKDGKGGMIAAGLGGAAIGAVGGAIIAHELSTNLLGTLRPPPANDLI
jgi:hypothetical protein